MKRQRRTQETERESHATAFNVGDKVRVRHGVQDDDYPDIPIGGWAGTITEIHDDGMLTVQWSRETLALIHPIFKKRCEKDGLDFDQYWVGADDLESDPGGPLKIEQPKKTTTKPLSPKDQDDRIRIVFDLTSNDPLPDVDDETLTIYHEYLSKNLVFPFTAEHGGEYGHAEKVKVIGLAAPNEEPMIDEMYGILCEVRMEGQIVTLALGELEEPARNRQLRGDYCYWFWNWH